MLRKATIFLLLFCCGCKLHKSIDVCTPCTPVPAQYRADDEGVEIGKWWEQFGSSSLNEIVETSLQGNFDLKQSWWRVVQACAQAKIEGAARFPEINLITSARKFKNTSFGFSGGVGSGTGFSGGAPIELYQLSGNLSYEVDLWRRIESRALAACMEMYATQEDLEATALTLTGTVVDTWFTIQESMKLLEVIEKQIKLSRTLLELVELRFSVGEASALDVYQQRLQLAQTIAEKPPVESILETSKNQLKVLLGQTPESNCLNFTIEQYELPPFPALHSPCELFENRPDLRAEQRRLMAADYQVAAAIADCFPKLTLDLSYGFQATELKNLFQSEIYQIAGSLLQPIFDAGRRRNEVRKQRAILCEYLNRYSQTFLIALKEVEDAVAEEAHQIDLLEQIEIEIELAKANLEEATSRYVNGLNDYLTVIAAVQSLQNLERNQVVQKRDLYVIRSRLYRAIGSPF